jgi:hypothetical protein
VTKQFESRKGHPSQTNDNNDTTTAGEIRTDLIKDSFSKRERLYISIFVRAYAAESSSSFSTDIYEENVSTP